MPKYHVTMSERWSRTYEVEANTVEDAERLAKLEFENGEDGIIFEYVDGGQVDDVFEVVYQSLDTIK